MSLTAAQILDREFFEIRAKILEVAASLDRLQRSEGEVADDPRLARILAGIRLLLQEGDDRAEQLQLLFSRSYDEHWKATFAKSS